MSDRNVRPADAEETASGTQYQDLRLSDKDADALLERGTPNGSAEDGPSLVIEHLSKTFDVDGEQVPILDDVNLTVDEGEFVTIVGHSGCGKSTLLKIVAGLTGYSNGTVVRNGKPVTGPDADCGILASEASGITSTKDLVGKKVVVGTGASLQEYYLDELAAAGVDPGEVQQINALNDAPTMVSSGQADALVSTLPPLYLYQGKGMGKIIASSATNPSIACMTLFYGRSEYLDKNPEAIKAIVRALKRGQEFAAQNPDKAWEDLSTNTMTNYADGTEPEPLRVSGRPVFSAYRRERSLSLEALLNIYNANAADNPPLPEDAAYAEQFRHYGIGAGLIFALDLFEDPELVAQLRELPRAVFDAFGSLQIRKPGPTGWERSPDASRCAGDYGLRAGSNHWVVAANPPESSIYYSTRSDATGAPLEGSRRYRIHFAADELPELREDGYWSITPYTIGDIYLIENERGRYKVGSEAGLATNEDGSVDLFVQTEPPEDPRLDANWLPAGKDGRFLLVFRAYTPTARTLREWWPPRIEPIE